MKVGIMSMQRIVNYGSYLQAYALKSYVKNMGHQVEFVDYFVEKPLTQFVSATKNSGIKRLLKMLSPSYRRYRREQIRMNQSFKKFYDCFVEDFLPTLGIRSERNYCPQVDVLIIGSDEVFNCTQSGVEVGFSRQLFGKDHQAKRLISYAASFGSTTLDELVNLKISDDIAKLLKSFHSISVRDENSASITSALTAQSPLQHIDPVLLYEFPEINTISIDKSNYIIVYAYAGRISDTETRIITKFAQKNNKKILALGYFQPFCDEYILANPLEVLAYIKNADYVITDTFHGTVFSIKYQVPFCTIVRDSNKNKLTDLLKRFDLIDRTLFNVNDLDNILSTSLDSDAIKHKISKYQGDAKNYLNESFNF